MPLWKPSMTFCVTGTGSTYWGLSPVHSDRIRFVMLSNFTSWCWPLRLTTCIG